MKQKYLPFALISVFIWGSSSVVIRLAFASVSVVNIATFRSWLGAVTLLVVCIIKKIPPPKKRDIPLFVVAGVLGFSVYSICYNIGFRLVTAATGNVVMAAIPVLTAVIARLILKERIKPLGWVFICVSFSGILILMLWNGILSINRGVLWIFAAAFLTSIYFLIQRRLVRSYTAIQSSAYCMFAGALVLSPFIPGAVGELVNSPPEAIAAIVYFGVCSSGLGYLSWSKALGIAKRTADVTNLLYLPPFVATILAFAFFKELPDWGTALGGIVILAGLYMYQKKA